MLKIITIVLTYTFTNSAQINIKINYIKIPNWVRLSSLFIMNYRYSTPFVILCQLLFSKHFLKILNKYIRITLKLIFDIFLKLWKLLLVKCGEFFILINRLLNDN